MKVNIKQVKSRIGATARQKATLDALGLRKNQRTVSHELNTPIKGMIEKIKHLVIVEEVK